MNKRTEQSLSNHTELVSCKFCGRKPQHAMVNGVYHQYICKCLHRTPTKEKTIKGAVAQWNRQNVTE